VAATGTLKVAIKYQRTGTRHSVVKDVDIAAAKTATPGSCRPSRDGGNAEELIPDSMAKASEIAAEFPRLRARVNAPVADYATAPEDTSEFGLQAILDGLEARAPRELSPSSTPVRRA
jgi:hypothetical protein